MADFLLQFALKMKRLVALCIVSPLFDENVMQDISIYIARNVVPVRKALWFYIGDEWPTRGDPDVPGIHYNQTWFDLNFTSLHFSKIFFLIYTVDNNLVNSRYRV